jgi:two-component system sensor histidine kinase DctS
MGSIIDISERKRLEERDRQHTDTLAQHARLNDMGLLASELAHELNQPLTTIVSYSAGLEIAMKRQPALDADLIVAVEEVNRHARKAGDIVNWIRKQTSRSAVDRKSSNINELMSEVLGSRMVQRQCANVRLVTSLASGLPSVTVDTIGIEQVMTNLIRNAADALKMTTGEKTITLSTQLQRRQSDGGEEILVRVADNGAGLQGRSIDVLCSAFYSTKQGGMGLGLGICRSIIEAHHGTFSAEDAPGGGATFFFTLPTTASALQAGAL